MKGFKIRLDIEMPMPKGEKPEEKFEECEACGQEHCPTEECPDHTANFRNGPIPALAKGEPVVESEYIKRVQAAEAKQEAKAKEKKK